MSRVALCKDVDARREAQRVATPTRKPRNAADAPCRRNPAGPGGFALGRRWFLLIWIYQTSVAPPRPSANLPRPRPCRGLPQTVLERVGRENSLYIPMRPRSRSLNLSNAVAVVAYEAWRQL